MLLAARLGLLLALCAGCRAGGPARSPGSSLADLPLPRTGQPRRTGSADPARSNADSLELSPGGRATLLDTNGPGVVRRLWIARAHGPRDGAGRGELVLRGWFDSAAEPCIAVPLDDFFAVDAWQPRSPDAPLQVRDNGRSLTCLLPMPFARTVRLEIANDGPRTRRLRYQVDYERLELLPPGSAMLHASYRQQFPCRPGEHYLVCDAVGRGRYIGCTLTVQATSPGWWGEGDEILTVDENVMLGTGTDNYFSHDLHLAHGPTDPRGAVGMAGSISRWHRLQIADPVEFRRRLRVEFEDWGRVFDASGRLLGNGSRSDRYASVAYWYQTEPHAVRPPLPRYDERRWSQIDPRVPGAPPETLVVLPRVEDMVAREGMLESRRRDPLAYHFPRTVSFSALRPGASLSLSFELRRSGPYDLFIDLIGGPGSGIFAATIDGSPLFEKIDGHAMEETPLPQVYLGHADLSPGRHVLELTATGRAMCATGYDIEIGRLRLQQPR